VVHEEPTLRTLLPGGPDAWELQFEYVRWRREHGLEPPRERLNRWYQAWDRISEPPK